MLNQLRSALICVLVWRCGETPSTPLSLELLKLDELGGFAFAMSLQRSEHSLGDFLNLAETVNLDEQAA